MSDGGQVLLYGKAQWTPKLIVIKKEYAMNNERKGGIIRFVIFLVAAIVLVALGFVTGLFDVDDFANMSFDAGVIVKILVMIAAVIAVESLVVFILGLPKPKSHRIRSVLSIVSSVLKYVAAIVIICWGLSMLGVNVSTIVASVGIIALIVGFSAESLIADMVTGAFMLFENQYNVGDIVEVDGFRGTVTNIGMRTTSITDAGGNVKIMNNSAMTNILNRSDMPSRAISTIGVPYPTDLEKLESEIPALMSEIQAAHPDVFTALPKYLGVDQLADSAVILKFVAEVDEANIFSGARLLNHDLLLGFRKLGVEVPYPQVDVHHFQS